jgi:large subunit ribosomal protein L21
MYAVIKSGGKQYKVKPGTVINVEKLNVQVGDRVEFDHVLMVADQDQTSIGEPYIEGKKVAGEVVAHKKGSKLRIIKFRRRKNSMTRQGHRQHMTSVKVTDI